MKLFFDEDVGSTVASRFKESAPEFEVSFVNPGQEVPKETEDVDWIRKVAASGYTAISHNRGQLRVEAEMQAIREHKLGIIYIPNDLTVEQKVALLLRRRKWLAAVCQRKGRPFAFWVSKTARVTELHIR